MRQQYMHVLKERNTIVVHVHLVLSCANFVVCSSSEKVIQQSTNLATGQDQQNTKIQNNLARFADQHISRYTEHQTVFP